MFWPCDSFLSRALPFSKKYAQSIFACRLTDCCLLIFRDREAHKWMHNAHSRTRCLDQVYDAGAVLLLRGTRPRRMAPLRPRRAHLHAFHESHSPVRGCVRAQATERSDWSRAVADIPYGQGKEKILRLNSGGTCGTDATLRMRQRGFFCSWGLTRTRPPWFPADPQALLHDLTENMNRRHRSAQLAGTTATFDMLTCLVSSVSFVLSQLT